MKKKLVNSNLLKVFISIIAFTIFLINMLPRILRWLGLHPKHDGKDYDLKGKKALIITTSQNTLGEKGKPTGVYSSEMTVPYYEFLDNGIEVHLASIKGGNNSCT